MKTRTKPEDKMIGAKIRKIYVNQTKKGGYTLFDLNAVLLDTDRGFYGIYVFGECCHDDYDGYIGHIELDGRVEGKTIKALRDVEFSSRAAYGLAIGLNRGQIFLEYRNSDNGYYGSDYGIEAVRNPDFGQWEELTESF